MASPRYGERWAQKWLDVVRYADTNGFELDAERPHAWRYRDYLIRSFNANKRYDRLVREQLAGDELYPRIPTPSSPPASSAPAPATSSVATSTKSRTARKTSWR